MTIQSETLDLPPVSQDQGNTKRDTVTTFLADNALLTARQLYEDILQVTKPTFWRMVKTGRFPEGFKINDRDYRWHIGTVRQWQDNQRSPR